MSASDRKNVGQLLDPEPTAVPHGKAPELDTGMVRASASERADAAREVEPPPALRRPAHPVLLLDPRALTFLAIERLRDAGIPLHVFATTRFEPTLYACGVKPHRLPSLSQHPEIWEARLLELAARIEPRPVLVPCSKRARDLLWRGRARLQPHFEMAHLETLKLHGYEAEDFRTERTLRRTIVRGDPAFEVQVTLDAEGNCNAACVLTWIAAVPPHLVVTSVEGHEVLERSLEWLRARRLRGYARLIWAPDRFGRVELQAAGTLPGSGWQLALADGVDFPLMWYACLARKALPAQFARHQLSVHVRVTNADAERSASLLLPAPAPTWRNDPLARLFKNLAAWGR